MHWLTFEKYETTCEWQVFPCLEKIVQENAQKSLSWLIMINHDSWMLKFQI